MHNFSVSGYNAVENLIGEIFMGIHVESAYISSI